MYQVTFIDGEVFTGGEPEHSMWDTLPNKPIKSVTYWLSEEMKWSFSDFEEYNHCVERVKGINSPIDVITKVIIMARVKARVYQIIYDCKEGTVLQDVKPYGQEYNGRPLTGWRFGQLNPDFPGPKLKRIA